MGKHQQPAPALLGRMGVPNGASSGYHPAKQKGKEMTLEALRAAADNVAAARAAADAAQEELNEIIRAALTDNSLKTKEIVEATGLTRARLYQIRDYRR